MTTTLPEALRRFSEGFYREPSAELAAAAFLDLLECGLPHGEEKKFLFIRAAQSVPGVAEALDALAASRPEHAGAISGLLAFAKENEPLDVDEIPLERPEDLDYLWGEFLLFGDLGPVERIASVLTWPDVTMACLAEWIATKPGFFTKRTRTGRMERLRTLGLAVDGQKAVDQDLLLWKLMSLGVEIKRELPFALTDAHVTSLIMKGTACWSLESNARQHDRVATYVERSGVLVGTPRFLE